MKKTAIVAAFLLTAGLLLTGCTTDIKSDSTAQKGSETFADNSSGSEDAAPPVASGNQTPPENKGEFSRQATQALSENQTSVFGKITAISDEQITLALAEMSEMQAMPEGEAPAGDSQMSKPDGGGAPPQGDSKPAGNPSSNDSSGEKPAGNSAGGNRPEGQGGGFEITLTGESAAYTLSTSVTVSKMRGNESAALTDIVVDSIVRMTVETDTDGKQTIVQIELQ